MSIYGYINEGFFKNIKRKKRIEEAKKYYKFVQEFLSNKYDLGYNDAETNGTLLAAHFSNISNDKIVEVFKNGKNKDIKKTKIKAYFKDSKDTNYSENFQKYKFDTDELISVVFSGDLEPYLFFRYKDNNFYTMECCGDQIAPIKKCSVYKYFTSDEIEKMEKIYFSKEEFDEAVKGVQ